MSGPGHPGQAQRSADAIGRGERLAIYFILLFASFAYNYNFVLVDYIRPFLTRHAGMSLIDTALLYSAQGSGVILASFSIPVLISHYGSRWILICSLAMLMAFTVFNELVIGYRAWLLIRFCVGITLTGTYTASMTMLANFFPPHVRGRLLSINMAMFSVALFSIGGLGSLFGEEGWRMLLRVGALAPAGAAALAMLFLPDDRGFTVFGDSAAATHANDVRGTWSEMLRGRRLWLTLACLLLAGLNFSAYQFYSGFITTYLMTVRHFGAQLTGFFVTVDGIGTLAGSLLWGWLADRYGRRINAVGFALAGFFTLIFLVAPVSTPVLFAVEFGYAICLSCTNIWAAYFAELVPVRLRPMGTSLFHGGHIVSLFAPVIVTLVAAHASLVLGMALAPLTFLLGSVIWAMLPETLQAGLLYRGFSAEHAGRPA